MATIDLKTLPKWKELMYGNHSLQIVARAPERGDSDKSEAVTFTTRRMTISDTVNPRATRLTLDIYDGETLKNHIVYSITPGSYFMIPSLSDIQGTVKFIGWLDDGTFNASDLSAITYGTGINPLSDRYGAVWQSATYASKDDVPLSMVIDETAKAFATVKFNFANVPEGTAKIKINTSGYPSVYNATTMKVASTASFSDTTVELASWATTFFSQSGTSTMGLGFNFTALDLDDNELGATGQIRFENVPAEATIEVQATFLAKLATPQNVTANGTTVSWDAVENATSYDVLADGVSIGEVNS